jgi:putative Ca2+/H+ antiporter (TMEM165/GDT1 family)
MFATCIFVTAVALVGTPPSAPAAHGATPHAAPLLAHQRAPSPPLVLTVDADAPEFVKLARHFKAADRDLDGVLSKAEFVSYEVSQVAAHKPSLFSLDFSGSAPGSRAMRRRRGGGKVPEKFAKIVTNLELTTASFWSAFFNSISMIIVTELGDKTFFIAAILAMRQDRWSVYLGAVGALALMTVLSVVIGFALPQVLPRKYTHFVAALLFLYFGIRLLLDAYNTRNNSGPSEELQEVEEEFGGHAKAEDDEESGGGAARKSAAAASASKLAILTQAFTLTFFAEWGDRSQIATIALAAAKNPMGVTLGGVLGHALCTAIAVLGGRLLAMKISERAVFFVGGLLFLGFAVHAFFTGPEP